MAVDTRDKRASALRVSLAGRLLPLADAVIAAGDRLHMFLYRGIAAGAAAAAASASPLIMASSPYPSDVRVGYGRDLQVVDPGSVAIRVQSVA